MDLILALKDAISIIADLFGIIALLMAYLSLEKKWARVLAGIGIVLIGITIVWNTIYLFSSRRSARALEAKTYQELSYHTSQFLGLITQMIHRASDGWLPTNENDFFSRRSVDLICRELNAYELPIISPRTTWSQLFGDETHKFKDFLVDIRKREGFRLEPSLVQTILSLEDTVLLSMPIVWDAGRRHKLTVERNLYIPYLCMLAEDTIEKEFAIVRQLVEDIRRGERTLGLNEMKFQLPSYAMGVLGTHRIDSNILGKTNRLSFYTYQHGWVIHGNEFVSENIQSILAIPFTNGYCKNVRVGILNGSLTGVLPNMLNVCNHVTVAFFFNEPVEEVTLHFRGLYLPYSLTAYKADRTKIASVRKNEMSKYFDDYTISVASRSADISWVEFGNKVTSTLIRAIELRR